MSPEKRLALARAISPWALATYWTTLFVLTHVPVPHGPPGSDKVLHVGAYSLLAFLVALVLHTRGFAMRRIVATTVLVLFAFAVFDEVTQQFVNRVCDPVDAVADWVGVIVGLIVFLPIKRRFFSDAMVNERSAS